MNANFTFDQFGGGDGMLGKIVRGGKPRCGKKLMIRLADGSEQQAVEIVGEVRHRGKAVDRTIWIVRRIAAG